MTDDPAIAATAAMSVTAAPFASFDTERGRVYTSSEGRFLRPDSPGALERADSHTPRLGELLFAGGAGRGRSQGHPDDEGHPVPCPCDDCITERAAIRAAALADAADGSRTGRWAERSWDGPTANFPGTTHDDTGRPKRIRPHRGARRLGTD